MFLSQSVCPLSPKRVSPQFQLARENINRGALSLRLYPVLLLAEHPSALWQVLKYLRPGDQFANRFHLALPRGAVVNSPCHPYFRTALEETLEGNLLTRNMNKHWKSLTRDLCEKTSEEELGENAAFLRIKTMYEETSSLWSISTFPFSLCLIRWLLIKMQRLSHFIFWA